MDTTAEKKIKGRKRHIVSDTLGLIWHVKVHTANIPDTIAGANVCYQAFRRYSSIRAFSGDAGYRGTTYDFVTKELKLKMDIALKDPNQFSILKKRWIVERSFAWLGNFRRLSKDFEPLPSVSENIIRISNISLCLKRLSKL